MRAQSQGQQEAVPFMSLQLANTVPKQMQAWLHYWCLCFFSLFSAAHLLLLSHLDVHSAAASAGISQASSLAHLVQLTACWNLEGGEFLN